MNKIQAICIASTNGKCLPVMMKSIEAYVPDDVVIYLALQIDSIDFHSRNHIIHLTKNNANSFGKAYNKVCNWAFERYDTIMICNDDIVFNPDTCNQLQNNWNILHEYYPNQVGYLACRSNYARGKQNIRWHENNAKIQGLKYRHEFSITDEDTIAPICAVISKDSWVDFEDINLFSDDIQCAEIIKKGKKHFVSTAYVHHVGSQSIGEPLNEIKDALNHLKEINSPYYKQIAALYEE